MNTICFFNVRLDFLIGLKINFDVRHKKCSKVVDKASKAPRKMPFVTSLLKYVSNKLPTKQCSRVKLCEQCIHRYAEIVNLARSA